MVRLLILFGISIVPMIATASLIDGQNKVPQGVNSSTARRSQNIEIAPRIDTNHKQANPQSPPPSPPSPPSPESVESEPSIHLKINTCGPQRGNANLRESNQVIGIISAGTTVELTGNISGDWIEVSGRYWPNGTDHPTNGTGWVHECWMTPQSIVMVDSEVDAQTEPLSLRPSRRRRSRLFRTASRPRKPYIQSTGELAGYVGRDFYDYALLYPRIAAYQSFWKFATDSPHRTSHSHAPISRPYQPSPYQSIPSAPRVSPRVQPIAPRSPIQRSPIIPSAPSATVPPHCRSVVSQFWDWLVDPGPSC